MTATPVLAAGALCWRYIDGKLRVLVIYRGDRADVSLPKGKVDPDSPWYVLGHFLSVVEERLRTTQEELTSVRRSYAHLLDALYPSNEVYVVARAV